MRGVLKLTRRRRETHGAVSNSLDEDRRRLRNPRRRRRHAQVYASVQPESHVAWSSNGDVVRGRRAVKVVKKRGDTFREASQISTETRNVRARFRLGSEAGVIEKSGAYFMEGDRIAQGRRSLRRCRSTRTDQEIRTC